MEVGLIAAYSYTAGRDSGLQRKGSPMFYGSMIRKETERRK